MVCITVLLCINSVSAMDWDNVKSYNADKKEVIIENVFGLGKELFRAELLTPETVRVIDRGEGIFQKVGEFKITNMDKKDFKNTFGEVETYDRRNGMKEMNKEVKYKYRKVAGSYQYPVTEYVCKDCPPKIVKYNTAYKYEWVEFNNFKDLPEGEVVIGVFVDVGYNEEGEWIPTFCGVEVDEWAGWTSSLDDGIMAYWTFNETSGTNALDVVNGTYNGTSENITFVPGLKGGAYNFSDMNHSFVNLSLGMFDGTNFSISVWVNPASWGGDNYIWALIDTSDSDPALTLHHHPSGYISASVQADASLQGDVPSTNKWTHIVFQSTTKGGGNATLWINGTLQANDNSVTAGDPGDEIHRFGFYGGASSMNGSIDEVGFWNRTLTDSEIQDLYNEGNGVTFGEPMVLTITLDSPGNLSTYFKGEPNDFNITVETGINESLINATLYLNGIANETVSISGISNTTGFIVGGLNNFGNSINWSAEACDTGGCTLKENLTLFLDPIRVNTETYNNDTAEGAVETFSVNMTKTSTKTVSTVSLIYNGTTNSFPYTTSGNEIISSSTISIPSQSSDVNLSFFWNVTFTDSSSYNTTVHNQSVENINIDNCTSYDNLIYNFSHFDEDAKSFLTNNNSIEVQMNLYDLDKSSILINFSQKFHETNPAQICLGNSILETINYSAYVTVKYYGNQSELNQSYAY